jgi:hypothetical protein
MANNLNFRLYFLFASMICSFLVFYPRKRTNNLLTLCNSINKDVDFAMSTLFQCLFQMLTEHSIS